MKQYALILRQKTHQSQKLPKELIPKVCQFLAYLRKYLAVNKVALSNILGMDETSIWFDSVSSKTVTHSGAKTVPLATTGHEQLNITVILAPMTDERKKKPFQE